MKKNTTNRPQLKKIIHKRVARPFSALYPRKIELLNLETQASAGFASGYVLYASFLNNSGNPIDSFEASFQVPAQPKDQERQDLALWIGLMNDNWTIQCVLQWGTSSGGGDFIDWHLLSMQVDGSGNTPTVSVPFPPLLTNSGDKIKAAIKLIQSQGSQHKYQLSMSGLPVLTTPFIDELDNCAIVLETQGVNSSDEYPRDNSMTFSNIVITAGQPLILSWKNMNPNPGNEEQLLKDDPYNVTLQFRNPIVNNASLT